MNQEEKKQFISNIMQGRVMDAKKMFEVAIMEKVAANVNDMRQSIAKQFFNKSK